MNNLTTTEKLLFLNKRNCCIDLLWDDMSCYCKINNRCCDHFECEKLKKAFDFEDFVATIELEVDKNATKA